MKLLPILCLTAILALATDASAREVRIFTWNVKDKTSTDAVEDKLENLRAAGRDLRPDILLLQEVTSEQVVWRIRDAMGMQGFYWAVSNFNKDDHAGRSSFEVAVISRYPLSELMEFDSVLDGEGPQETLLRPPPLQGINMNKRPGRGFLWARLDEIDLTITVAHLKSSLGSTGLSDKKNAESREFVAAAVAAKVNDALSNFPDYAHLVAGDFNVGHSDTAKNGVNLASDCFENCGGQDLYDETHALLGEGLVDGLRMTNLTLGIPDTTFPGFPGSPIDNIYVVGANISAFSNAEKASKDYGSDHLAVLTVYDASID